jgi:hypothetical protein
MWDAQLSAAADALRQVGCLSWVSDVVIDTWQDNLHRHSPAKGDDFRTLGFVTAANISNRLAFSAPDGVVVEMRDGWALVRCAGYELKVYKLPGQRASVSPNAADWTASFSRQVGAAMNSDAVQLAFGFLGDDDEPLPLLRRLHLAHTADEETGEVVQYLGFPCLDTGEGPWFAVMRVGEAGQVDVIPTQPTAPAGPATYDDQPEPQLDLRLRRPSHPQVEDQ